MKSHSSIKLVHFSVVIAGAFVLPACAPAPDKVCAHANGLAEKEGKKPIANCEFRMQMKQDTKHAEYKTLAPCILEASSTDEVNQCLAQQG